MSVFNRVMRGLNEALDHARGEDVPGLTVHIPAQMNVGAIRRQAGLSQTAFAATIGVQVGTLRNWEQGRRHPEGPARVLLALLEQNPRIVAEVLGAAAVARTNSSSQISAVSATKRRVRASAADNTTEIASDAPSSRTRSRTRA